MDNQQNTQGLTGNQFEAMDPVQQVGALLHEVRQYINQQLAGGNYMHIRLRMDNQLGQMIGFLHGVTPAPFMSPGPSGPFGQPALADLNQPITRMFGVDIDRAQPVRPGDLVPNADERETFRQRTQAAAKAFLERTDEELLHSTRVPGGEAALRAVAKHAGHENYKEQPMDLAFIQEVRLLLQDKRQTVTADNLATSTGTRPAADASVTGSQASGAAGGEGWPADVPADNAHLQAADTGAATGGTTMEPQQLVPGAGLPAGTESQGPDSGVATRTLQPGETLGAFKNGPAPGGEDPKAETEKKAGPGRPPKSGGK